MTGIRAVKAFRREARNERVYSVHVDNYRDATRATIQLFGIFDPGLRLLGNVTMEELAMFYNSFQNAASALEKISGVLEEESSVPKTDGPTPLLRAAGAITFSHVTFGYTPEHLIAGTGRFATLHAAWRESLV